MTNQRINLVRDVLERDIASGRYHGAVIRVGKGDDVAFEAAVGHADGAKQLPLGVDSVFTLFSLTKAFTNVLMLQAVERGDLTLTTTVSDVIPEFRGAPRDEATLFHLLTHTAGMPGVWTPKIGMFEDDLGELVAAVCENVHGMVEPGSRCDYAPVVNHVLMGEMLRRVDPRGRTFKEIAEQELFEPLEMTSTSFGVRADLRARKVVPDTRGIIPIPVRGRMLEGQYSLFDQEHNEAPHVGACSTVEDVWKFAQMLRQGGAWKGRKVLSARTLRLARQNFTGNMHNELYRGVALRAGWEPPPAYLGLGFSLRGEGVVHHQFGTLTTPETFGNYGAGSTMYWVDPELDLTFVCLTAGLLSQSENIERFQRLSDATVAALT